jgi:TolB-like protein
VGSVWLVTWASVLVRDDAPGERAVRALSRRGFARVVAGLALVSVRSRAAEPSTVALLYFDYEGKNPELVPLRKGLAQMLTTDLVDLPSVRIVERARLEEVLEELALAGSGKIDRASAARIGKLLGAKLLVLGAYFEIGGVLRVDARVVETETGRVRKSVGAIGKADDALACEVSLAEKLRTALQAMAIDPARDEKTAKADGAGGRSRPASVADARPAHAAPRPKVPVSALAAYGRALDALDRHDPASARASLEAAVRMGPGFALAAGELARLPP